MTNALLAIDARIVGNPEAILKGQTFPASAWRIGDQ